MEKLWLGWAIDANQFPLNIACIVNRRCDAARLSNAVGVFGADDDSSVVWLLSVQSLEVYAIECE